MQSILVGPRLVHWTLEYRHRPWICTVGSQKFHQLNCWCQVRIVPFNSIQDFIRVLPSILSHDLCVTRLFIDYLCALLQKGLLLQGRLYITDTRLAFYSNIIGHVKRVTIRHEDIDSIKKVNVAIIPTGLDITSEGIEVRVISI